MSRLGICDADPFKRLQLRGHSHCDGGDTRRPYVTLVQELGRSYNFVNLTTDRVVHKGFARVGTTPGGRAVPSHPW